MAREDKIRSVRDGIREGGGRTEKPLTGWSNCSSSCALTFEGGSQSLKTTIDGFTDLWWFAKAGKRKGLANRTATVSRSFAPFPLEELGDGWERGEKGKDNGDEKISWGTCFLCLISDSHVLTSRRTQTLN